MAAFDEIRRRKIAKLKRRRNSIWKTRAPWDADIYDVFIVKRSIIHFFLHRHRDAISTIALSFVMLLYNPFLATPLAIWTGVTTKSGSKIKFENDHRSIRRLHRTGLDFLIATLSEEKNRFCCVITNRCQPGGGGWLVVQQTNQPAIGRVIGHRRRAGTDNYSS